MKNQPGMDRRLHSASRLAKPDSNEVSRDSGSNSIRADEQNKPPVTRPAAANRRVNYILQVQSRRRPTYSSSASPGGIKRKC